MVRRISFGVSFLALLALIYFAREINDLIPKPDLRDQDIYYSYVEGERLVKGENPYARILDGNMSKNKKYATYFPIFYELSFFSQKMGLSPFERWIIVWQNVFIVFEFGIALLLYLTLARNQMEWIGVFGAAFWLFNRWTLEVVSLADLDFIPIFFLVLSLAVFPKNKWWGLFIFSLSLGFKQLAIFVTPLYLIWVWQETAKDRAKTIFFAGLTIASVPLISGIPFLLWNARGFILSILFSATRSAAFGIGVPSLDALAGWNGLTARIGMLALMGLVYLFALRGRSGRIFASVLVMTIFLDFNTILYSQYPVWVVPLIPLIFLEFRNGTGLLPARTWLSQE